jgi:hypothetical protein
MKRKTIIIGIAILLAITVNFSINYSSKDKIYLNKNIIKETNNKALAVYIENDNGKYDKSDSIPIRNSGYTFNASKSVCNGSANLSWNDEEWGLELENIDRENTKCYLYFDK